MVTVLYNCLNITWIVLYFLCHFPYYIYCMSISFIHFVVVCCHRRRYLIVNKWRYKNIWTISKHTCVTFLKRVYASLRSYHYMKRHAIFHTETASFRVCSFFSIHVNKYSVDDTTVWDRYTYEHVHLRLRRQRLAFLLFLLQFSLL